MKDPDSLAPDPELTRMLDTALARAWAIYGQNTDEHGDEPEVYSSAYMQKLGAYLHNSCSAMRDAVDGSETLAEQVRAILQHSRDLFQEAAYSGNCPLALRFVQGTLNDLQKHYRERIRQSEHDDDAAPLTDAEIFLSEVLDDVVDYNELAIEALDDISQLTRFQQAQHGVPEDLRSNDPHALLKQRYRAVHKLDPAKPFEVPEVDQDHFLKLERKYYQDELLGPFARYIPANCRCPEIAWFIIAAADVVRDLELEEVRGAPPTHTRSIDPQSLRRTGNSFVDHVLKRGLPSRLPEITEQDIGRTTEEILADPKGQRMVGEIVAEVCAEFPQLGRNPVELTAAHQDFMATYFGPEDEPEKVPPAPTKPGRF